MKQNEAEKFLFQSNFFRIEPLSGELWPHSRLECIVHFSPDFHQLYQEVAYCDLTGKEKRIPLSFRGQGAGALLTMNPSKIEAGAVYLQQDYSYKVCGLFFFFG
jgi:hydrocephalus-inducing protein